MKRKIEDLSRFNNIGLPMEDNKEGWVFYVVSLNRLVDRKTQIIKSLLPFIGKVSIFFYDAIDWKDYSLEDLNSEGYDAYHDWKLSDTGNMYWDRELKLGELACSIGHYNIWRHIKENNFKYSLILEDDSNFQLENFLSALNTSYSFLSNNNCDIFYISSNSNTEVKEFKPGINICGYEYNTHAYIVTLEGANKIINSGLKENLIPADEFLSCTFFNHPREDLRNLYSAKNLVAYKLADNTLIRQGPTEDLDHSDIFGSTNIK